MMEMIVVPDDDIIALIQPPHSLNDGQHEWQVSSRMQADVAW